MRDLLPYLERAAATDGLTATSVPFMRVNRRSHAGVPHAHVLAPCIGVFVAGHKRIRLASRDVHLRRGDTLVVPHATPIVSHVVQAPYLAVLLAIDADLVASLAAFPRAASADIAEPFARLVRLLDTPAEIPALAPLVQRELFYRLLAGPGGDDLRALVRDHDPAVAAARAWLDAHYAEPFSAERLAAHVRLGVSALYARFKARTHVTPLQYQKQRRLEAARRLLLRDAVTVAEVARRVGYASVAQFTRDYRRRFAVPPRRDIANLRSAR